LARTTPRLHFERLSMDFSPHFPTNDHADVSPSMPVGEEMEKGTEAVDLVGQAVDEFDADFDFNDFVAAESNSVLNAEETQSAESDSFINAQPSMDAAEFEATAFFSSQIQRNAEADANDETDTSSASAVVVPEIVEESILTPEFLVEPKVDIINVPLNAIMTEEPLKETGTWEAVKAANAIISDVPVECRSEAKETVEPIQKSEPIPKKPRARQTEPPVLMTLDTEEGSGRRSTRVRSVVQRLSEEQTVAASASTTDFEIPSGLGVKLGDVPDIVTMLGKKTSSDKTVVALHRLLFNRPGDSHSRKGHLRAFNGFPSENAQLSAKLGKLTLADLKAMGLLLCLDTAAAKTKDQLVKRLESFLQKPDASMVDAKAASNGVAAKKAPAVKKRATPAKKKTAAPAAKKAKKTGAVSDAKPGKDGRNPLTPEIIDDSSDLDSDVEKEVLQEIAADPEQQD
jgi:hypothetical protein